jgi:hypothetical protein
MQPFLRELADTGGRGSEASHAAEMAGKASATVNATVTVGLTMEDADVADAAAAGMRAIELGNAKVKAQKAKAAAERRKAAALAAVALGRLAHSSSQPLTPKPGAIAAKLGADVDAAAADAAAKATALVLANAATRETSAAAKELAAIEIGATRELVEQQQRMVGLEDELADSAAALVESRRRRGGSLLLGQHPGAAKLSMFRMLPDTNPELCKKYVRLALAMTSAFSYFYLLTHSSSAHCNTPGTFAQRLCL